MLKTKSVLMHRNNPTSIPENQISAEYLPHDHRWRDFTAILLAGLSLSACNSSAIAPVTPTMHDSRPPTATSPGQGQPLRVIVKFRQAVPYRDKAFLQDIARQVGARVAYISSVSLDTHVYQIEPHPGQSPAEVLRSLSAIPSVLRVETDAVARPS